MFKRIFSGLIILLFIHSSIIISKNLSSKEKDWMAKAYRKDKNGQYRNKYGHLAPGEQLGFMHSEKNLATKEANRLKKKGGQAKS